MTTSLKLLVMSHKSQYFDLLTSYLTDRNVELTIRKPLGQENFREYDGIIISGGSLAKDNLLEALHCYRHIFDNTFAPILAICLGFKIIGRLYGTRMRRLEKDETGVVTLDFHKPYPLAPSHQKLRVYEDHSFELLETPIDFENYATSPRCRIQALKHKRKPIFAVQFHPEVDHQNEGHIILDNFISGCLEKNFFRV